MYRGYALLMRPGYCGTVICSFYRSDRYIDQSIGNDRDDALQKARNLIDGLLEQ